MFETIGLIGSICFAINSWPQAWLSYRTKTAKGVSAMLLIFGTIGGICSLTYVIATEQYAIIPNFFCGLLGLLVVSFYKIKDLCKGTKS